MMARSYLYVPADRQEVVAECGRRGADAIILDLEDGVAPGRKDRREICLHRPCGRDRRRRSNYGPGQLATERRR